MAVAGSRRPRFLSPSGPLPFAAAALALVFLLPALPPEAAAQSAQEASDGGEEVAFALLSPRPGEPAYGVVEVAVDIFSAVAIERVELFVNGRAVAEMRERPYKVEVDLGYDNREHTFRVVAHTATGKAVEELFETPAVSVAGSIDVRLQQLYVTVERGGGRSLELDRGAFTVYDDGERQELVTFERGDVPMTAVVMLDASGSMTGERIEHAVAGAGAFIDGLAELDQGMVMLFSDRLLASTPFSAEPTVLQASLSEVRAEGGTALNDHLYLALKQLESQAGRPVVILFSDGTDAHSALPMEEVLWKAGRSQALLYWLRLEAGGGGGDTISTAWRDGAANRHQLDLLEEAVASSGGRVVPIAAADELEAAFRDILRELRGQYVLGYYPKDRRSDGSWREVRVRVDGLGRARHRGGYIDD